MAELFDCHLHTRFSGDSDAEGADIIRAAKAMGLSGITFTDHLDWDYPSEPGLFDLDIEGCLSEYRKLKEEFETPGFSIGAGIELGLQEHLAERHHSLLLEREYDFVIGSVHQVNGEDPYYDAFFEGKSIHEAYRSYLDAVLKNIRAFSDFDSLGHLDYICRYGQRVAAARGADPSEGLLRYEDFPDEIDAVLSILIEKKKALEINTAPFHKSGLTIPNPSWEILRRYHALGGRMITLGTDAHRADDVGVGLSEAAAKLKEIGFEEYSVFRKRKAVTVKL